jgi:hypothetical protein
MKGPQSQLLDAYGIVRCPQLKLLISKLPLSYSFQLLHFTSLVN